MRGCGRWIAGLVVASLASMLISLSAVARADEWRVTVRGGDVDLGETPVVTEVPDGLAAGIYQLRPTAGGDPLSRPGLRARRETVPRRSFCRGSPRRSHGPFHLDGAAEPGRRLGHEVCRFATRGPNLAVLLRSEIVDGVSSRRREASRSSFR